MKIIATIFVMFLVSASAFALPEAPGVIRRESIFVGPASNSWEEYQLYRRLLALAGRSVVRIVNKSSDGMYTEFETTGTRPVDCDIYVLSLEVFMWQNLETKVQDELKARNIESSKIVDIERAGQFLTGGLGAVNLYFCK